MFKYVSEVVCVRLCVCLCAFMCVHLCVCMCVCARMCALEVREKEGEVMNYWSVGRRQLCFQLLESSTNCTTQPGSDTYVH